MRHAIILLLCLGNLSAATYYIDYSAGSDSNNGTAKATPWKHSPFMQPFSGSYTHVSGNDFIYKGGVTWPRAAVPSVITGGGTSGNHSTHGVDVTWFNGGSFTKPIFTSGGLLFSNNSIPHQQCMFRVLGTPTARVEYVDIENLEMKQWGVNRQNIDGEWGVSGFNAGNLRVTNCKIWDWEPIFSSAVDKDGRPLSSGGGGGVGCSGFGVDVTGYFEAIDCEIIGPLTINPALIVPSKTGAIPEQLPASAGGGYSSGSGIRNITLARRCVVSRTTQGIFTVTEADSCEIFHVGADKHFDTHENAFRPTTKSAKIHGCWVHDTNAPATQTMWGQICWGGSTHKFGHIYNNIFGPNVGDSIVGTGDGNVANSQNEYWFYNNLVFNDQIRVGVTPGRGLPFSGPAIVANNLCISDSRTVAGAFPGEPEDFLDVAVYGTAGSNKVITTAQANAAGMTLARRYKPNAAISGVTNAGVNLAGPGNPWGAVGGNQLTFSDDYDGATRTGTWDVGPYEFGGTAAAIPGNIQLTSDTYNTPEGTNVVITATRGGGDDGAVGVSWATSNTSPVSATAGTDYTATSGTGSPFSWANGDSANKTITITIAQDATIEGSESFLFTISAPTGGAELGAETQAIVTINDDDAAPTIPLMGSLTFNVADMLIEPPFVNTSGLIDQPVQTTTPSSGGRARARVTIPSTGNYRVAMTVNANTTSSDSLFLDFDGEPTTPTAIWDVLPPTTGTTPQPRNVSWRGTGTFTAPQFVDKEWTLTAGEHTLYIRGREANMDLQSVTIFSNVVADTTPPTPNPATIADVQASSVSVIIESEVVADITGPVQYQFEVTGPEPDGVGSFTSNFQSAPSITVPLYPGLKYRVRVRSQDSASPPNVGSWSEPTILEVPTIEGAGATNPFTPKVKAEGSERSSFFLSNSFYGPGAYTDPAAAQNWTNGMVNMFAFYPPVDAGMTTFITSRNAGFMFYQNGATRPGGTSAATIAANSVDAGVLCTTVGKDRSLWNLMAEWDQSGGGWVSGGRPSYIGQTRVAAYGLFTDYYLTNSPPLGTYLALPQSSRPWRLASVSDSSQNTFIAFQMGIDIGLLERAIDELGDSSTGLAYARGAGRLYGKPWGIDISTWRTSADSATEFNGSGQHTGGWTPSYLRRHIYTAYMGGAHIIEIEPTIYYLTGTTLNPFGTMTDAFADFSLTRHPYNTIGASVVPMALIFDYYSGFDTKHGLFNQYNAVWYGDIPYSSGDYMINNFFKVAYPNHWLHGTTPGAPWSDAAGYQAFLAGGGDARPYEPMPTTRWGDTMDVTLNTATADKLSRYRIVTLMGGVTIDTNLRAALTAFATAGGTVVVNASQVTSADESLLGVTLGGSPVSGGNSTWTETSTTYTEAAYLYKPVTPTTATVLATTTGAAPLITSNVVGSGRVILTTPSYLQETDNSDLLLIGTRLFDELYADVLPAVVSSPAVQYMFNQSPGKLITTIVNSSGSTWAGTITALISGTITAVKEYIADTAYGSYTNVGGVVTITGSVPAYDIKIYAIEFTP